MIYSLEFFLFQFSRTITLINPNRKNHSDLGYTPCDPNLFELIPSEFSLLSSINPTKILFVHSPKTSRKSLQFSAKSTKKNAKSTAMASPSSPTTFSCSASHFQAPHQSISVSGESISSFNHFFNYPFT